MQWHVECTWCAPLVMRLRRVRLRSSPGMRPFFQTRLSPQDRKPGYSQPGSVGNRPARCNTWLDAPVNPEWLS